MLVWVNIWPVGFFKWKNKKHFARNCEKRIILGTSDAWSTSRLSHRPSKPAYYYALTDFNSWHSNFKLQNQCCSWVYGTCHQWMQCHVGKFKYRRRIKLPNIYISWKLKFQIQNSNSKTNVARESMEHATNECMSGNSNREDGLSCRHRREWVKMKLSIQIIPILALCGVCLLWYIIMCGSKKMLNNDFLKQKRISKKNLSDKE